MGKNVNLSPPWVTFYREINALFEQDPDVEVEFHENDNSICVYVEGQEKADAIDALLPDEKTFGNITVQIVVIPANKVMSKSDLFNVAFSGNPAFAYATAKTDDVFPKPFSYVVFKKKVVQFFNDDLRDINGNMTTLYQNIAKDVFGEDEGICFCTEADND